jgi:hypothetical protein
LISTTSSEAIVRRGEERHFALRVCDGLLQQALKPHDHQDIGDCAGVVVALGKCGTFSHCSFVHGLKRLQSPDDASLVGRCVEVAEPVELLAPAILAEGEQAEVPLVGIDIEPVQLRVQRLGLFLFRGFCKEHIQLVGHFRCGRGDRRARCNGDVIAAFRKPPHPSGKQLLRLHKLAGIEQRQDLVGNPAVQTRTRTGRSLSG